jgi:REP element-mobilizing transposase RayT
LTGSLPQAVLNGFRSERLAIQSNAKQQQRELSKYEQDRLKYLYSEKIEKYLDELHGDCWLRNPEIAQVVVDALKHFDKSRYHLYAWCVMPNHVHVVFKAISSGGKLDSDLIPILHSWKSFTAHKANKLLKRNGEFWQSEYYDHLIRTEDEFSHYVAYTLDNPVKGKLCNKWHECPWTGCSDEIKAKLEQPSAGETPAPQ